MVMEDERENYPWEMTTSPSINTYGEEAQALREAGDIGQAKRFSRLSQALAKPGQIRESAIQRFGIPISQALSPGWDEDEHRISAQGYYDEGRNDADYRDINELTPEQKEIMRRNMSKLVTQKKREDKYRQQAQGMEQELRDEDPTKFFADKERPFGPYGEGDRYANEPNVRFGDVVMGEPMDIAFQLLKERKSPEAWAHKLEYDKQYQKNPKRVKYREQLNAERRKRGIYGKGGKDVSHTQGGKLTLESAHSNRARHFKGKGTLRRVKVR